MRNIIEQVRFMNGEQDNVFYRLSKKVPGIVIERANAGLASTAVDIFHELVFSGADVKDLKYVLTPSGQLNPALIDPKITEAVFDLRLDPKEELISKFAVYIPHGMKYVLKLEDMLARDSIKILGEGDRKSGTEIFSEDGKHVLHNE